MIKETVTQVQQVKEATYRMNPRLKTPRHTLFKLKKILRQRKKILINKGKGTNPIKLLASFSEEALQARKGWQDIVKMMNGEKLQPRILHPAELSFRFEREIKIFKMSKTKRIQYHHERVGNTRPPDCLLRNLYAGQEATVRTGHGTTDWFQIGKGVCQGCILSPCLINLYAEYIMRNAGLEEV